MRGKRIYFMSSGSNLNLLFVQRDLTCTWSVGWTAGPGRTTSSGWRRWWWWWMHAGDKWTVRNLIFPRFSIEASTSAVCTALCYLSLVCGARACLVRVQAPSLATNIHTLTKFQSNLKLVPKVIANCTTNKTLAILAIYRLFLLCTISLAGMV